MTALQEYAELVLHVFDPEDVSRLHYLAFANGTIVMREDCVVIALPYEQLYPAIQHDALEWDEQKGQGSLYVFYASGSPKEFRQLAKASDWHKLTAHRGLKGGTKLKEIYL